MSDTTGKKQNFANIVELIFSAEPFTTRGEDFMTHLRSYFPPALTEEVFFNKLYVEPFQGLNKKKINNQNLNGKIPADDETDDEYIEYDDRFLRDLQDSKNNLVRFESRLRTLGGPLFLLQGSAGCGKTTYVHKLIRVLKEENENYTFNICDFEVVLRTQYLNGYPLSIDEADYDSPLWKFISMILEALFDAIKTDPNNPDYAGRMKGFCNTYKDDYGFCDEKGTNHDDEKYKLFFDGLENLCGKYFLNHDHEEKKISEYILSYIKTYFVSSKGTTGQKIVFVMGLLIRFYFCLARESGNGRKYICVFENIEYYVKPQSNDIDVKGVYVYANDLREMFIRINEAISQIRAAKKRGKAKNETQEDAAPPLSYYGILVVARDTSSPFVIHDHPGNEERIDITRIFPTDQILLRREEYYLQLTTNKSLGPYWTALKEILLDDLKFERWELGEVVFQMYNGSRRRIFRMLARALATIGEEDLEFFLRQWKIAFGPRLNENMKYNNTLKYLCRCYIFAILVRYIDESHFYRLTSDPRKYDYAKQIITVLVRNYDDHKIESTCFVEIVDALLGSHNQNDKESINIRDVKSIAEVLFLLNEQSWEVSNWGILCITEGITNQDGVTALFIKKLADEWNRYCTHCRENTGQEFKDPIRIGITEAGRLFYKTHTDFEFHAAIYARRFKPIFNFENLQRGKNLYRKGFGCVHIITDVMKNTFAIIKNTIKSDTASIKCGNAKKADYEALYNDKSNSHLLFKKDSKSPPIVYPLRIIQRALGYIGNYVEYVEGFHDEKTELKDKDQLLQSLYKVLASNYVQAINVIQSNEDYFKPSQPEMYVEKRIEYLAALDLKIIPDQSNAKLKRDIALITQTSNNQ